MLIEDRVATDVIVSEAATVSHFGRYAQRRCRSYPTRLRVVGTPEYVGNLAHQTGRICLSEQIILLSHKTLENMTRAAGAGKGMEVWDNGPKPLLGAIQKWFVS